LVLVESWKDVVRFATLVLSAIVVLLGLTMTPAVVRAAGLVSGSHASGGLESDGRKRAERAERTTSKSKARALKKQRALKPHHAKPRGKRVAVRIDAPSPTQPAPRTQNPNSPLATPPIPTVGDTETTATPFDIVQLATLRPVFRRPTEPAPGSGNRDEIALGARLFAEQKLSSDHKMSCATCHDPDRAFTDGRVTARGNKGQALPRNTPPLWNLAWQKRFYWDARADRLEAQVKDAIEREGEMDGTLQAAALWLSQDPSYVADFQRVYRADVLQQPALITKAIAAYERTLVSPQTRFDRWAAGDDRALGPEELAGFRIFTGKGRCLACHGGWRFTDDDVHDIGLSSPDRGAAALPGSSAAGRAFKTPSLREIDWSGPYMHDGSLTTLDAVLDHYTRRLDRRASLAPELRAPLTLTQPERRDLIAFLRTLSSERRPRAP
jgi:cytochrome c peroxidase